MTHASTLPRVELPPPGPALRLHEAAAVLRRRAERARTEMAGNAYWDMGWRIGIENAIGDVAGGLASFMDPAMADGLADWLDGVAQAAVKHAAQGFGNCQSEITEGWPETLADRILKEVER